MSKIDEMLKRMCPDGVEYVELGAICEFIRGNGLQKSDKGTGNIPIILYGELYTEYDDYIKRVVSYASEKATQNCKIATEGDILLPISSTTKEAQIGKASVLLCNQVRIGGDMLILKHKQNPSYLMYVINSSAFELQKMKYVRGTTIMHLQPSGIAKIKIPLPPLEIQKEIVKILDKFTEYDTELQAELQARIKQYECYRDKLLNFDKFGSRGGVTYRKLGEVCDISAGGDVPKNAFSKQKTEECDIPIYSNGTNENALYGYTNQAKISEPCVTISARGTIGFSALRLEPFYPVVRLICIKPNNDSINVAYLYYFLQSQTFEVPTSGIPQLTVPMVAQKQIPIPPLKIQSRIVSVLDNFDKICSDLKIGLPAEIEKRQQQYEFYRDAILTFVEKGEITEHRESIRRMIQYIFGYITISLEECCTILDRQRRPITKSARSRGKYPYYGANGVQDYVNDFIFDGEYVLVGEDGSVMNARGNPVVTWASGKIWVNNHAHVIQNNAESDLRYLYHFLQTIDISTIVHGNIPKINQKDFRDLTIKLPPLGRQRQIVEILDRFDQLCHDFQSGLPAEIEKHQKRYEYYRDKLLSFPEKQ